MKRDQTIILCECGSQVPVPEGYSVDRVVEILRDVGHRPTVYESSTVKEQRKNG